MASEETKLRIAMLHPDLGIGGAERLVVDAALGLQNRGHTVEIYTSHFDRTHAFEETCNGTLTVHHIRPPIPRSIFGKFHIICAMLRQFHLTLVLLFSHYFPLLSSLPHRDPTDVFIVDQLSACIPLLRWGFKKRVVFYCHFPDKLLAGGKAAAFDGVGGDDKPRAGFKSLIKKIYRIPVDWAEEATTAQADIILANSQFTGRVFEHSFPSIKTKPVVVYPGINTSAYQTVLPLPTAETKELRSDRPTFVSLNRFERKKNVELALRSFAVLLSSLTPEQKPKFEGLRLVIAGGYDPRLKDNIDTLTHLCETCDSLNLTYTTLPILEESESETPVDMANVIFLLNFTTPQRQSLLLSPSTLALLYTPTNEHFGIGPVEGMISGLPVLACESGGPVESIEAITAESLKEGKGTGWLRKAEVDAWADAMKEIVALTDEQREELAKRAKERVKQKFGMDVMCGGLQDALLTATGMGDVEESPRWIYLSPLVLMLAAVAAYVL